MQARVTTELAGGNIKLPLDTFSFLILRTDTEDAFEGKSVY